MTGRSHAKDIGVGNGACSQAGAHDVSDASTDAGGGSTVGFDGAGMVVRFDFHHDDPAVADINRAGVLAAELGEPWSPAVEAAWGTSLEERLTALRREEAKQARRAEGMQGADDAPAAKAG